MSLYKDKEKLKSILSSIPKLPGVYQYFDKEGNIIYIGKAKQLRKRVSSYFNREHDQAKTYILVKKIAEIKHIIVDSEEDALLLENNLIKKYKPKYNILLKDDKSFPWICIKNEDFPRVFSTRNLQKDGSEYYGPYTNLKMVSIILDVIKSLFKLRTCKHNLNYENVAIGRYKLCLEYHIQNCHGPCQQRQTKDDYDNNISQIRNILKGNINQVIARMKSEMIQLADNYEFEKAHLLKQKIDILSNYQSKSTIVSPSLNNLDVYSILENETNGEVYVNFMKVINGAIMQVHTIEVKQKLDENIEEILEMAIIEIRQKLNSNSKEIIVPFNMNFGIKDAKFIVPQIGDKKKLLQLSERNLKYYKLDKLKKQDNKESKDRTQSILELMKSDLRLNKLPSHIECFDNSNIQGTNPVASCVVFKNARPSKKDYRKFNIKTVVGANDFASMEEIIYRRYKRLIDEKQDLPQLVIIDGGKGQLGAALNSFERLNIRGEIAVIGIAKRLEEIFFPGDQYPLYLDKNSYTLKVIQHLRNEAHRFAITFHRDKRSKNFIKTELDDIKGVGQKSISALYNHFKTIEKIKEQNLKSLSEIVGKNRAKIIYEYLKKNY
ncbi:MAG: excinuclease ABC subunit UvrC [Marinifilaceae bacterium]|jgi:excinuclease ABC subunit C|nr:excinuclease ABC subunit UvrC [Marinifilaceae bacterium]